ncbi:MAG TPA: Rv3654c family TadE-like protein [Pseudolysinimonas sp.]|jgi:secretion/DNA translocation related TadE-like protein|nr:Rv3654c family TadE-like protein [Pseudolysinimonas sp.]
MLDERGSGSVLALALLGAAVIVAVAVLGLGSALATRQRVIAAADGAALAAADAAAGAVPGDPCAAASGVAAANRATLVDCALDGLVATVEVSGRFGPVPFRARSTAGPAP